MYFKSSWTVPGNIMHEYETKLRKQKLKKAQSKHKKGVVLPETKKVGSLFVLYIIFFHVTLSSLPAFLAIDV